MYVDKEYGYKEGEALLDLSKPSLQALSHILRHKELWPKGFDWYFWKCTTCAMGLAWHLWKEVAYPSPWNIAATFAMPITKSEYIFFGDWVENDEMGITPEMVADQIDKYLPDQ
jgi:hypothetical protein